MTLKEFAKLSAEQRIEMQKVAIGPFIGAAARLLPALGNFAKGALFFGGKGTAGTVGKATGGAMMAKGLFSKKQPEIG